MAIPELQHAFAGMKADAGFDRVESFPAGGDVPFGVVLTADDDDIVAAGGDGRIVGLSLHTHTRPNAYQQYDCISILTRGWAWAVVADGQDVTKGGAVQFNADGEVGDSAGTSYPNALFKGDAYTTPSGDVIVEVELHAPTFVAPAAESQALTADDVPNLPASKIASGTLDANRIPTLDQSKIKNLSSDLDKKQDKSSGS